jgi:hypothetical protein
MMNFSEMVSISKRLSVGSFTAAPMADVRGRILNHPDAEFVSSFHWPNRYYFQIEHGLGTERRAIPIGMEPAESGCAIRRLCHHDGTLVGTAENGVLRLVVDGVPFTVTVS